MYSDLPDDEHAEKPGRLGDNYRSVDDDQADVAYVENDDILEPMTPPLEGDVEDHVWVDQFGDAFVREVGGAPPQARVGDTELEG
jgi:hypothetical protein